MDGRYKERLGDLPFIFSEKGLNQARLEVEIKYLIRLAKDPLIPELETFSKEQENFLSCLWKDFSLEQARQIKKIEKKTNHDVKAVEYFIREQLFRKGFPQKTLEFVHFALTSEDVNNLAYRLMLKKGLGLYLDLLENVLRKQAELARLHQNVPILALTHGQSASPTTVGKEWLYYHQRLNKQKNLLRSFHLYGKCAGATGNWSAHKMAYPKINWIEWSRLFVESLGLCFSPVNTQIESQDSLIELYQAFIRVNNILKDLDQDLWMYISRGVFKQKFLEEEVGSSTMPHKVNPIDFENSEGNAGVANALLDHFCHKLAISRFQRDLSDSTVIRNQGLALGYSYLALHSLLKGLNKLSVDPIKVQNELKEHWEVLAEPTQILFKKWGKGHAYEQLKALSRGRAADQVNWHKQIRSLGLNAEQMKELLILSPEYYTGEAAHLVDLYLND